MAADVEQARGLAADVSDHLLVAFECEVISSRREGSTTLSPDDPSIAQSLHGTPRSSRLASLPCICGHSTLVPYISPNGSLMSSRRAPSGSRK
jgi:hypothetical protein